MCISAASSLYQSLRTLVRTEQINCGQSILATKFYNGTYRQLCSIKYNMHTYICIYVCVCFNILLVNTFCLFAHNISRCLNVTHTPWHALACVLNLAAGNIKISIRKIMQSILTFCYLFALSSNLTPKICATTTTTTGKHELNRKHSRTCEVVICLAEFQQNYHNSSVTIFICTI